MTWLQTLRQSHPDTDSLAYAVADRLHAAHHRHDEAQPAFRWLTPARKEPWIKRARRVLAGEGV